MADPTAGTGLPPKRLALSMFLDRLRELLEDRDMTQSELARGLEVGEATVSEWFTRGRVPQGDVFLRLPWLLRVNGHWLLTGEGPRDLAVGVADPYQRGAQDVLAEVVECLRGLEGRFGGSAAARQHAGEDPRRRS
jgi:hypothetical protein